MQVSWIPPSHPLKEILPPHVPLFLLQLKIQLMRARSPMKMLFALSLSAMRILTWTISQASIYVDWLENLPFKVCILTSRTPMAASQNRYLSGHNYRWNATSGNLNAHQIVSHPFNQQFVSRSVAWDLVRPVCTKSNLLLIILWWTKIHSLTRIEHDTPKQWGLRLIGLFSLFFFFHCQCDRQKWDTWWFIWRQQVIYWYVHYSSDCLSTSPRPARETIVDINYQHPPVDIYCQHQPVNIYCQHQQGHNHKFSTKTFSSWWFCVYG